MILDKARKNGAFVWESQGQGLAQIEERIQGIRVESAEFGSQELFAPIVVDASGHDPLPLKQNWMVRDLKARKFALWAYFKGAIADRPGRRRDHGRLLA